MLATEFTDQAFKRAKRTLDEHDQVWLECPTCEGSGDLYTSHRFSCWSCKGRGTLAAEHFKEKIKEQEHGQKRLKLYDDIKHDLCSLTFNELERVKKFVQKTKDDRGQYND